MEQYSLHTTYASLLSSYSNYDLAWVQFIRDHFYHIKKKSTVVELDPYRHNSMKYRLEDFLADNNIPTEMAWIVLYINQLGSNVDFRDITVMILPDVSDIKHLRDVFDTVQSHKKRVIKETPNR
ncbi:MAG: hypothetical protein IKA36_06220 [Clostridia bacterium]|nr:hypothetical protein [Clostridia bacterium]